MILKQIIINSFKEFCLKFQQEMLHILRIVVRPVIHTCIPDTSSHQKQRASNKHISDCTDPDIYGICFALQ